MSDSLCPTSDGASAATTAARSVTTLRKTLRVIGIGRARRRVLAAHARHHGHVARGGARRAGALARLVVVVAEDDGHVRRERHEREARLADRDEHLGEIRRGADPLLRVVERAKAVVVLLDDERLRDEVLDLLEGEDAGVVGVVLHGRP